MNSLRLPLLAPILALLTPACVLFDPLESIIDDDAGAGDAGADAPDADIRVAECEAGAAQAFACGNCGTMTVACLYGTWFIGLCQGEGVCAAGEQQACGGGETGLSTCQASCTWGPCTEPPSP